MKDKCYNDNKKSLDGVNAYAECVAQSKKDLLNYEMQGKYHLLFIEMSANKNKEFKLVESISSFIEKYNLNTNKLAVT